MRMKRLVLGAVAVYISMATHLCAADAPVFDDCRAVINLNGEWQTRTNPGVHFAYPPPADGWQAEKVPHRNASLIESIMGPYGGSPKSLLNDEGTGYRQKEKTAAWFKRGFIAPANLSKGKRVMLYFHGMAFKSETWLNGAKLGVSLLGQVPIEYDVTDILKPGAHNEIVVGLAGREALLDITNKTFLAPLSGTSAGIWGNVELRFLPEIYIEDVFIKTSVKDKRIVFETTVVNAGKKRREIVPEVLIMDKAGIPQVNFAGTPISMEPGERKTFVLSENWVADRLWTPETPALYLARMTLQRGQYMVDSKTERFGFREFEIRGRDFYLNGSRRVLLRNSFLDTLGGDWQKAMSQARMQVGKPYNCIRLHIGFDADSVLDSTDEIGLMAMPESAWHNLGDKFSLEKPDLWLPNVLEYTRKLIKLHRNRPSVVIWSLTNESFWGETNAVGMAIAAQILNAAREMDPTRPQQGDGETYWGKRLPIINIHYPEGSVGQLRQQYPNSGLIIPNDLYWLTKNSTNDGWRATFEWDRPLILGEYWDASGEPDAYSSFMGESAFDWEKWRYQDWQGRDNHPDNAYHETLMKNTDVYRLLGVAGLNPWAGDRNAVMPPVSVRPVDFHPNFFGGASGARKVVVFNDGNEDYNYLNLQCRMAVEGKTVWQDVIKINVPPGASRVLDVPIAFPAVESQKKGLLTIRLRMWAGGGYHELARHEEEVFILPPESLADLKPGDFLLLDTTGQTAGALAGLGLKLEPFNAVASNNLQKSRVLIAGAATSPAEFKNFMLPFVADGGRVLMLQQQQWIPPATELPEMDARHATTRSWKRWSNHPVTAGLEDRQLSYWRPDNLVSIRTFHKPSAGRFKALLDSGGLYGLGWAPLVEVPYGQGVFLLSQLNLTDRVKMEPVAGRLLGNMLRYCRDYRPAPVSTLRVLAGTNNALIQTLTACSVVSEKGLLGGNGPILVDASYQWTGDDLTKVSAYLQSGGNVWLHGFASNSVGGVAALLPFKPLLKAYDPTVLSAVRRSDHSLMNNLSSFDFFWTRINLGARSDYFEGGQATARLGGEVLVLPSLAAGEYLIEPGLLVRIPVGKGTVLFDTLLWEHALGAEANKVSRLVTSLCLNLGADVQIKPEKAYRYFQVDIREHVNMCYFDEIAGDGKGGWTDQGENDMRFFLINHTGLEGGMDVAVGKFPTQATLAGRPFTLIDPKQNNNRSVITLRGGEHGPTMPEKVTGMAVGRRAEKLWFLQTAAWGIEKKFSQELGRYVIRYENGQQEVFPLRRGVEIADWWNPLPLAGAKVAWTGKNPAHAPVGIYCVEWTNPHPEKTIVSLDLIGNLAEAQIVLIAVTGGVEEGTGATTLIAEWRLADLKNGKIGNRVKSGGALAVASKGEVPVIKQDGRDSLRFKAGDPMVTLDSQKTPGLAPPGPVMLEVVLAPEDKPGGYFGGIYQACAYGQSGFRLVIDQGMNLAVEAFTGKERKYFKGKTALAPGRFYTIGLKFDGARGYIFVDGKLDGSIDMPLPAPFDGPISVGQAGGKDYFFNGLIGDIRLFRN